MGAERLETEVGGSRFVVFRRENKVEIYRVSREFMPRWGETRTKAVRAVEQTTGCKVRPNSLKGDVALMTARLDCS